MPPRGGAGAFDPGSASKAGRSLSSFHGIASKQSDASLEVSDVSSEFPRPTVLKFFMSDRQEDTLCYKTGYRLARRLGTLPCMANSHHILVVDDDLGLRELL